MKEMKPLANVIGDVVASRATADRAELHQRLDAALEAVNQELAPPVPLRVTVGDEFQGGFETVGRALSATLRLRVLLLPRTDLRHGIGWGPTALLSEAPRVEDGPGWWAAREAIEAVAGKRVAGQLRTAYRRAPGAEDGPDPTAVNAALVTRDALLAAASSRSVGVLRGLLAGMSQKEIAEVHGISPSAVSQRIRRDGLDAIVASDELLGQVR